MFKLCAIVILILALSVTANHIRQKPLRRHLLARQQLQPTPSPFGYPAAGVTPEIPFKLPTETEKPDLVYGPPEFDVQQPDEVYGPPETKIQQPNLVYGPPETKAQQPNEVYGPPENKAIPEIVEIATEEEADAEEVDEDLDDVEEEEEEEEEGVIVDENGAVISVATTFEKPARLIYQRFPPRFQPQTVMAARLTKAKIINPANFVYTARFQSFPKN